MFPIKHGNLNVVGLGFISFCFKKMLSIFPLKLNPDYTIDFVRRDAITKI